MDIRVSHLNIVSGIPNVIAFGTIVLNDEFVVKDIRLIKNSRGDLYIDFPARVSNKGHFSCIAYPINNELRKRMTEALFKEYEKRL